MTSPLPGVAPGAPAPRISTDARFLPGQVVAERYRMLGLLGKGGMGEVYRADDLKLGQPVALKFLPAGVEAERAQLGRFLNEVKLSLKVTHPHVCRVHDVGEVGGRHFLSMEYVDGEDLASLLRRIGRLPEDKAIEIARQLCAGLQAAHDEGVLHRDLKPANVMIDGRGRAKITDFGLASATAGVAGREAQAGTPHYMAPEQFDGRELSVQTDLYALGLLIHELFTGRRVFDGRTLDEQKAQRASTPASLTTQTGGLNPVVERAIQHCLNPDPAKRPRSAKALADALPGGDPLAIALAAGETPSPELVAGAGGTGALRPWLAAALLAIVLTGLGLIWYAEAGIPLAPSRIPLPKTRAELQVAAQQALGAAGETTRRAGKAVGFAWDEDYFRHIERTDPSMNRWNGIATVDPAPLSFWYREAPAPMAPLNNFGAITMNNPPLLTAGMTRVRVDPSGRLQELVVIPADEPAAEGPWAEPDWSPIFAAAGLAPSEWAPAEPRWPPFRGAVDVRRAWTKGTLRIEATAFRGRPTWFRIIPEWRRPAAIAEPAAAPIGSRILEVLALAITLAMLVAALVLARRNIRQGRGDVRGATRLAVTYLIIALIYEWTRLENAPASLGTLFNNNVGPQVYEAVLLWAGYLAIEPYVRRWWPATLVTWSRVLDGRFRDPMVGRDFLLGAAAGIVVTFAPKIPFLMRPPGAGELGIYGTLMSWTSDRAFIGALLNVVAESFHFPIAVVLTVLVLRVIFRRTWLAYLVMYVVMVGNALASLQLPLFLDNVIAVLIWTLMLVILTRLGFFALLATILFSTWYSVTLTTNPNAWYFHHSVIAMALFGGLAVYAAWISIGNQNIFQDSVLDA
jgi:hypothetical protein